MSLRTRPMSTVRQGRFFKTAALVKRPSTTAHSRRPARWGLRPKSFLNRPGRRPLEADVGLFLLFAVMIKSLGGRPLRGRLAVGNMS